MSGSQRVGVSVVLVFFGIGWIVIRGVDEVEGVLQAGRTPIAAATRP